MKSEWFDPHKSFLSLGVVWVTVGTLLSMSIASASVIIYNSELTVDLTFNGFNQFISIFRFPLGIAALIIPMVALLAANHRSEQTKEQIRVTNAQNVFSNYYKHIEEFTKYLKGRVNEDIDLRFVHSNLYPDAAQGDYALSSDLLSNIYALDNLLKDILDGYPSDINEDINRENITKYSNIIRNIYSYIYGVNHHYDFSRGNEYSNTYLFKSVVLIEQAQIILRIVEPLCKFSTEYISQVSYLDFDVLDMRKIYVQEPKEKEEEGSYLMWDLDHDKKDQTFEEANGMFIDMLENNVNKS